MHKHGTNRKNKEQENPRKATWTSWKRDVDNKSAIPGSVHIRDGREIETRASTPTCL